MTEVRDTEKLSRADKKVIAKFLDKNYQYGYDSGSKVKADDTYRLFIEVYPGRKVSKASFIRRARCLGLKDKKDGHGILLFYATPLTDLCRSFHAPQQLSVDSPGKLVNFNLINIQGLISQEQNKRYLIDEFAGLKGAKGKIVAITESHLQKGHHTKAEILKDLPGYSLARSDRDVDYDNESLDKCGGTLLIASNDLMMKEVGEYCFSNGNCELTTAELPELKISILVIYRPSGKNFCMEKYKEIMRKAEEYLRKLKTERPEYKVVLAGDFNFPSRIVKWVRTENGVIGNAEEGNDRQKIAYGILSELAVEFEMEQMVDKPTRERNVLDLIYTDIPEVFTVPTVEVMRPISDHNLIRCDMLLPGSGIDEELIALKDEFPAFSIDFIEIRNSI